jgi:hypothetical protein
VDRAVRFMVTTGRPEFAPEIWPLVSHSDNQIRFGVLRSARRFRPGVLGRDRDADLLALPEDSRDDVFAEIASNSGMDGMELAVRLAKQDTSTAVRVSVIRALLFRRADRLAAQILKSSDQAVWEEIAKRDHPGAFHDPNITARLKAIEADFAKQHQNMLHRLELIADMSPVDAQIAQDVETMIASPEFPAKDQHAHWALSRVQGKCPERIAAGMMRRLELGLDLPFRSREFFAAAPLVDDGPIAAIACRLDGRNEAGGCAASVIGPRTIGELLRTYLAFRANDPSRPAFTKAESDSYSCCQTRLQLSRAEPFVHAWLTLADTTDPAEVAALTDLFALHGETEDRGFLLEISEGDKDRVNQVLLRWKDIFVAADPPHRGHLAKISAALARLGRPSASDTIFTLIDIDLKLRREQLAQFRRSRNQGHTDVHMSYLNQYQNHLAAIAPEDVRDRLKVYLLDPDFGVHAACVLKIIDDRQLPKSVEKAPVFGGPDFSEVRLRRAALEAGRTPSDTPAVPLILSAVDALVATGDETSWMHALQLAAVAEFLPHAPRPDMNAQLLGLAVPWYTKKRFMTALVLAGELVSADMIVAGIDELFERAKKEPWRLGPNTSELDTWLELVPFSDRPEAILDVLPKVPDGRKTPWELRSLLRAFGNTPATNAAELLMRMADHDERLCSEYDWLSALYAIDTPAAYLLLFDRVDANPQAFRRLDGWTLANHLAPVLERDPKFRGELLRRYQDDRHSASRSLLERMLSRLANAETVIAMLGVYTRTGRVFDSALAEAIRQAVIRHKPSTHWKGAYEIHSVGVPALRKQLFAAASASDPGAEIAKSCLEHIDELRDEYGRAEDEPRHPDAATGAPWPFIAGLR